MSSKFWNSELLKAGFVGIEVDTYNGEMSNYLSRTLISSVPLQDHLHDSTVYLLCHDKMSSHAWIEQVEDHFFQHGIRTQRLLTSDQIQPKQHIISLLDLDSPFFSHISEKNWKALQQLIENFHQILWVTELVEFDCENPDFSLVMGVSRTARQEQEVAFGTFQVDNFDSVTAEALLKISRRFFKAKDRSGLVDMDYEFALHHGTIYIPRVQWSSLADKLLQDADIKSPIKLEIESYGTLDSMHWAEDISTQLPSENEIEVDVQFVGLNFRVGSMAESPNLKQMLTYSGCDDSTRCYGQQGRDWDRSQRDCAAMWTWGFAIQARRPGYDHENRTTTHTYSATYKPMCSYTLGTFFGRCCFNAYGLYDRGLLSFGCWETGSGTGNHL